jgi:hypothetical protein
MSNGSLVRILAHVLPVSSNPIGGDGLLSSRKIDLACASHRVQTVLQSVLDPRVPLDVVRLRPKILEPVRAAEFQGNQVINLATLALFLRAAVFRVSLPLDRRWNVSGQLGVSIEIFEGIAYTVVLRFHAD